MSPKFATQWVRNAFDDHDRDELERALTYIEKRLALLPPDACARGAACVCTTEDARRLCSFKPSTVLAPCVRGPACSCSTLEKRLACSNVSARPQGDL